MKNIRVIIAAILLSLFTIAFVMYIFGRIQEKTYSNSNFRVSYDSTWKVKDSDNELRLIHKRTKSELRIQCKILDTNFINTSLGDLIDDIIYSVEQQNKGYSLINRELNISDKYEGYAYLYENNDKQVLVHIYKKDAKLIIVYYEAESKYYDIVLDSVDMILDSLEFVFE